MNFYKLAFYIGIATTMFSCYAKPKGVSVITGEAIQVDSTSGSAPWFTTDAEGHIAMSWAQDIDDSTSQFCYAVSSDNGKSFGKPIVIPGSTNLQAHSENLPKIIFKPSGGIIALWGTANPNPKNKYSGLVYYSSSNDKGATWDAPRKLVTDTASYDQRYYDVALLPNGEAAIIWLDNRKTGDKEGSSLYFATTKGNSEFSDEQKIAEGCCQCCRTDLFIDSRSGIHVIYRGIIEDTIRDMLHTVSTDKGKTFSLPKLISNDRWVLAGCPHTGPAMAENKQGLHFAWFTGGNQKGCFYTQSTDNGNTFVKRERVSEMGSHPQIAQLTGERLLLAWDESFMHNGTYKKKIAVELRDADGAEIVKQYVTGEDANTSYPVIAPLPNGTALIAYTRKTGVKSYIWYQLISFN
jgi:hypothetical protein